MSEIDGIISVLPRQQPTSSPASESDGAGFAADLKTAVDSVQQNIQESNKTAIDALVGDAAPHDAMLALTKAELSFKMMTQTRNKLVEAYREIMRMNM